MDSAARFYATLHSIYLIFNCNYNYWTGGFDAQYFYSSKSIKSKFSLSCIYRTAKYIFWSLNFKNTDWGIYGLVSLAAGLSLMRNLLYTVPVGALYLGKPVKTFFPVLLQSSLTVIISGFILHLIFSLIDISTWPQFFGYAIISMIALIITQLVFLFSRQERNVLLHSVSNKVQKVFRQ